MKTKFQHSGDRTGRSKKDGEIAEAHFKAMIIRNSNFTYIRKSTKEEDFNHSDCRIKTIEPGFIHDKELKIEVKAPKYMHRNKDNCPLENYVLIELAGDIDDDGEFPTFRSDKGKGWLHGSNCDYYFFSFGHEFVSIFREDLITLMGKLAEENDFDVYGFDRVLLKENETPTLYKTYIRDNYTDKNGNYITKNDAYVWIRKSDITNYKNTKVFKKNIGVLDEKDRIFTSTDRITKLPLKKVTV
jgi:hypothetical protein